MSIHRVTLYLFIVISLCVTTISVIHAEEDDITSEITNISSNLSNVTLGSEKGTDFTPHHNNQTSNVSTFTGAFLYTLPIASLTGRNGLSVSFDITYSSDEITKKANLSNAYYQSSWVGFGWTGHFGYIKSDQNETFSYEDDEYFLVTEQGAMYELVQDESNIHEFHTKDFTNWKITRTIGASGEVASWTLLQENGQKYIYGNADSSATRYSLRVGEIATNPRSSTYQENPYQWDLYKVSNASGGNVFYFSYQQQLAQLVNSMGTSPGYTQASYLKRITGPDGRYIEFILEDRGDYEALFDSWHHNFYERKRLKTVYVKTANGSIHEQINFTYDYLNKGAAWENKKSILTSVKFISGSDETEFYMPYLFAYETNMDDNAFGALTNVVDPNGEIKKITYLTSNSFSESELSMGGAAIIYDHPEDHWDDNVRLRTTSFTDNIAVFVFKVYYNNYASWYEFIRVFYWNGKWEEYYTDIYGYPEKSFIIGTGANYAVISKHTDNTPLPNEKDSLILLNIENGYINRTSRPSPYDFTPSDGGCPTADIAIYPGEESFILAKIGQYECSYNYNEASMGWAYYFDGEEWHDHDAWYEHDSYSDTYYSQSVEVHDNSFIADIYLEYTEYDYGSGTYIGHFENRLIFGTWRDGVLHKEHLWGVSGNDYRNSIKHAKINFPFAAFVEKDSDYPDYANIYTYKFNETTNNWDYFGGITNTPYATYNNYISDLVLKDDYLAWVWYDGNFTDVYVKRLDNESFDNDFVDINIPADIVWRDKVSFNDHSVFVPGQVPYTSDYFLDTYSWNGTSWVRKRMIRSPLAALKYKYSNNTLAIYGYTYPQTAHRRDYLWVSRYNSDVDNDLYWSDIFKIHDLDFSLPNPHGKFAYEVTDDRIMLFTRLTTPPSDPPDLPWYELKMFDFINGNWEATNIDIEPLDDEYLNGVSIGMSRNNYYFTTNGSSTNPYVLGDYTVFRVGHKYQQQYEGLATHTLVENIETKTSYDDPNPITVTYSYENVIKDPTDNYSKINITSVTQPAFVSEATFTKKYHHFNDLKTNEITDLVSASLYGVKGGGYILDGMLYKLEIENSAGLFTSDYTDITNKVQSLGNQIYRAYVESETELSDGLSSTKDYTYDNVYHQLVKTTTSTPDQNGQPYVTVDSTKYAFNDNAAMLTDNAINLPGENISLENDIVKNKEIMTYVKQGHWKMNTHSTYIDDPTMTLTDNTVTRWDSKGNVIEHTDARNIPTAYIFDKDSVQIVADIKNSTRNESIYNGFEEGFYWDDWLGGSSTYRYLVTDDVFSGKYSFRINENPNTTDKNWGVARFIDVEDLHSDEYYASCWVKTNHTVFIYCWCVDESGNTCTNGYKYAYFDQVGNEEWTKIETIFDLSDVDPACFDHISVQVVLQDNGTAVPESYAIFDDIRFHPVDAQMNSVTYDPVSKQVTSISNNNNVPIKYDYDQLNRLVAERRYDDNLIKTKSFYYTREEIVDLSVTSEHGDGLETNSSDYTGNQKIYYNLNVEGAPDDMHGSSSIITNNENISISCDLCGREYDTLFGTIALDPAADNISLSTYALLATAKAFAYTVPDWFEAEMVRSVGEGPKSSVVNITKPQKIFYYLLSDGNSTVSITTPVGSYQSTSGTLESGYLDVPVGNITLDISGSPAYARGFFYSVDKETANNQISSARIYTNPDLPNYVKTAIYRDVDDSTEVVNYLNPQGKTIQSRSKIGSGVRVSVTEYDARGRISKEFKPYELTSSSIFTFDPATTVENDILDYYDGSPGADCEGFPYKQFIYENSALNRLSTIYNEGEFRNFPLIYTYGLSTTNIGNFNSGDLYQQTVTDENQSQVMTYSDRRGRLRAEIKDPAGQFAITYFFPDRNNLDTLIIQPEGHQVSCDYNNIGWLLEKTDPDNGIVNNYYDQMGNLRLTKTATDAENSRFHYKKYDDLGRMVEEGIFDDEAYFTSTNAFYPDFPVVGGQNGNDPIILTEAEYDAGLYGRNMLTKSTHYPTGKPDYPSWEEFTYGPYGKLVSKNQSVYVIDGGNPRTMSATYNFQGQYNSLTYPNGKTVSYTYNSMGETNEAHIGSKLFTGANVRYTYWPTGKIRSRGIAYSLMIPEPPELSLYEYNARDMLTTINGGMSNPMTNIDQSYALELTYTSGAYEGNGTANNDYPSGYYNGNIASYGIKVEPGNDQYALIQNYAYDKKDQLVGVQYQGYNVPGITAINYDNNGNVDNVYINEILEQDYIYYPNSNRLEQITGLHEGAGNFTYTGSGSITSYSDISMNMSYNYQEQLSYRSRPFTYGTNSVSYWYDAEGKRIAKKYRYYYRYVCDPVEIDDAVPSDPTSSLQEALPVYAQNRHDYYFTPDGDKLTDHSLFDNKFEQLRHSYPFITIGVADVPKRYCTGWKNAYTGYYYFNDLMLCEYSGSASSNLISNYLYIDGKKEMKFHTDSDDNVYYLTDNLGSTIATWGGSGSILNWYQYLPFGDVFKRSLTSGNSYEYTGKELESELSIELNYFGARYYDPEIRRFMSVDPMAQKYPEWNPYVYSGNNPIKNVDVDGNFWIEKRVVYVNAWSNNYNPGYNLMPRQQITLYKIHWHTPTYYVEQQIPIWGSITSFQEKVSKGNEEGAIFDLALDFTTTVGKWAGKLGLLTKRTNDVIDQLERLDKAITLHEILTQGFPTDDPRVISAVERKLRNSSDRTRLYMYGHEFSGPWFQNSSDIYEALEFYIDYYGRQDALENGMDVDNLDDDYFIDEYYERFEDD